MSELGGVEKREERNRKQLEKQLLIKKQQKIQFFQKYHKSDKILEKSMKLLSKVMNLVKNNDDEQAYQAIVKKGLLP